MSKIGRERAARPGKRRRLETIGRRPSPEAEAAWERTAMAALLTRDSLRRNPGSSVWSNPLFRKVP